MVDLFHEQVIHEFGIIYPLYLFGALRNYFIYVVKLIFVKLIHYSFLSLAMLFIFGLYMWLKTWSWPLLIQKILAYLDLQIYYSPQTNIMDNKMNDNFKCRKEKKNPFCICHTLDLNNVFHSGACKLLMDF